MQDLYPYALILHIFCAIVFVGYIFFDVFILSKIAQIVERSIIDEVRKNIRKKIFIFMPFILILLGISGLILLPRWMSTELGYLTNNLQYVLMVKISLAFVIFVLAAYAIINNFFIKNSKLISFNKLFFSLSMLIILCAKLMYYV